VRRLAILLVLSFFTALPIAFAQGIAKEEISSVMLDSISVDKSLGADYLRLTFRAKRAGNMEAILNTREAVQKSLEYFFMGLSMNDEAFWVNLNPDEPERVIDPSLRDTDLGRIMLLADFRLKSDVSRFINPQNSKEGKEFWQRLYAKAQSLGVADKIPVVTRLWIVPGDIEVSEGANQVTVVRSRLRVNLEPAYRSQPDRTEDKKERELDDFASGLMEELVLPYLNKEVNESYAYSDLREVYQALALADWYKQKFGSSRDSLLRTVNLEVLDDLELNCSYSPDEVYGDYLKSLKQGEYSFEETDSQGSSFGSIITTRHYFSGGVDFRDIRFRQVNSQPKAVGDDIYYSCDLFIPQGTRRPLQYAKNQVELIVGGISDLTTTFAMLSRNLPAIIPLRSDEQIVQSVDYIGRTDRIILSEL